ncbi:unnamed protein product [Medioppia subpectinata]|uniref:40S ribosomal protein S26 n=1 Tax=Medioppia subpectinata TaxID=1979941 RepID=A0A7R9KHH3_9ACAR|nr:unnamed protein product [Medioppia subpectinata]CAG2103429.1 unnamed protein product [Medioppia subpectinata]
MTSYSYFDVIKANSYISFGIKRQNHGRQKKNRGSVNVVQCVQCGRVVPKDKAISRSSNQPIIEGASMDDLNVATIYKTPEKYYHLLNQFYSSHTIVFVLEMPLMILLNLLYYLFDLSTCNSQ